jgi:glucokinase
MFGKTFIERLRAVLATTLLILCSAAAATGARAGTPQDSADPETICARLTETAEKLMRLPRMLLHAVSLAESGRWNAEDRASSAWPWTVYAEGKGRYYPSREAALQAVRALRETLGLTHLTVVNDFTAIAHALPHLGAADRRAVGGGEAAPDTPVALIGPGTGLGVSGLVPDGRGGWTALATEGGHVTLPATDARDMAVIDYLRGRYDHVSAERVLSGPGLVNLYEALARIEARDAAALTPAEVTARALLGDDPLCTAAVALFCGFLGTVAGDLALSLGARGGVWIAGGIVPRLGDAFAASPFRARFEAKGRFGAYLKPIPTWVVTHPYPAFPGLAALAASNQRRISPR